MAQLMFDRMRVRSRLRSVVPTLNPVNAGGRGHWGGMLICIYCLCNTRVFSVRQVAHSRRMTNDDGPSIKRLR